MVFNRIPGIDAEGYLAPQVMARLNEWLNAEFIARAPDGTVVVLASDSFNRFDTLPGKAGDADCYRGGAVTTWEIDSDMLILDNQMAIGTHSVTRYAKIQTNTSNQYVQGTTAGYLAGGVVARWADTANHYRVQMLNNNGSLNLERMKAGAVTTLATMPAGSVVLGDKIGISVVGSVVRAYINGVQVLSVTDANPVTTGTKAGILSSFSSSAWRMDDWMVASGFGLIQDFPPPPRVEPSPVTLASDSFNRANTSAGSLGTTDQYLGGPALAWTVDGGQLQILSNQVGASTLTTNRWATVDLGVTDHKVSVRASARLTGGLVARFTDQNNCYQLQLLDSNGRMNITRKVAGVQTSIADTPAGAVVEGDVISLRVSGSTIIGYINGVERVRVVDTSPITTGTKGGIQSAFSDTLWRVDEFVATSR